MIDDFVTDLKKVLGAGYVGEQEDVGFRKIRTHETREHILAEYGGKIIDRHPVFKTLLRQNIGGRLEVVEGIIDQH